MTLSEVRRHITNQLKDSLGDEAITTAKYLLCDVLNISLTELLVKGDEPVSDELLAALNDATSRLSTNEPLQYVTGKAYFRGNTFYVDNNVLIPRPETEKLIDLIGNVSNAKSLLDIGTGSGCIAISSKLEYPHLDVSAVDVSKGAILTASRNAKSLDANVNFIEADILADNNLGKYDIVVSNPPYICLKEMKDMLPNVLDYEPHLALFVSDDDPLIFYRRITQLCCEGLLNNKGTLLFEINEAYSNETSSMMAAFGMNKIEEHNDCFDKPRFVTAQL